MYETHCWDVDFRGWDETTWLSRARLKLLLRNPWSGSLHFCWPLKGAFVASVAAGVTESEGLSVKPKVLMLFGPGVICESTWWRSPKTLLCTWSSPITIKRCREHFPKTSTGWFRARVSSSSTFGVIQSLRPLISGLWRRSFTSSVGQWPRREIWKALLGFQIRIFGVEGLRESIRQNRD